MLTSQRKLTTYTTQNSSLLVTLNLMMMMTMAASRKVAKYSNLAVQHTFQIAVESHCPLCDDARGVVGSVLVQVEFSCAAVLLWDIFS